MSPYEGDAIGRMISFPRVSGDEPLVHAEARRRPAFSPRERG